MAAMTYEDLIQKGRQAQVDLERSKYEQKKAKAVSDIKKAAQVRFAEEKLLRRREEDSSVSIGDYKTRLFEEMTTNIRARLENETRAEMRNAIHRSYEKNATDLKEQLQAETKLQLVQELEPVVKAELAAQFGAEVFDQVKDETNAQLTKDLIPRVKIDLRAELETEVKAQLVTELRDGVRAELTKKYEDDVRKQLMKDLEPMVKKDLRVKCTESVCAELRYENIARFPDTGMDAQDKEEDRIGIRDTSPSSKSERKESLYPDLGQRLESGDENDFNENGGKTRDGGQLEPGLDGIGSTQQELGENIDNPFNRRANEHRSMEKASYSKVDNFETGNPDNHLFQPDCNSGKRKRPQYDGTTDTVDVRRYAYKQSRNVDYEDVQGQTSVSGEKRMSFTEGEDVIDGVLEYGVERDIEDEKGRISHDDDDEANSQEDIDCGEDYSSGEDGHGAQFIQRYEDEEGESLDGYSAEEGSGDEEYPYDGQFVQEGLQKQGSTQDEAIDLLESDDGKEDNANGRNLDDILVGNGALSGDKGLLLKNEASGDLFAELRKSV